MRETMTVVPTDPGGLRLLLARHGATDWNDENRYQGRTDLPLSVRGIAQATQLGEWLAAEQPTAIIHSGSQRTADTIAHAIPVFAAPVIADPRWVEIDHGDWEGLTYHDLLAQHPQQAHAHWADPWHIAAPQGETLQQVSERVEAATDHLLATYAGRTVLLVAHATSLQLLLCRLLGGDPTQYWRWKLDLGSLSCIELYASGPIVNWLNRGYSPPPPCV
jgi:2,3-bisphosphoglycerate-dependent phosphoglycerate mutase/probable phosphoglycerate mutase